MTRTSSTSVAKSKMAKAERADRVFLTANKLWERGRVAQAFRLMLQAARAGSVDARLNVGVFYEEGIGTRADILQAARWYRKAASQRFSAAAHNLGLLYFNQERLKLAERWLRRAVSLGADESLVKLAALHLRTGQRSSAIKDLRRACRSESISDNGRMTAKRLLRKATSNKVPADRSHAARPSRG